MKTLSNAMSLPANTVLRLNTFTKEMERYLPGQIAEEGTWETTGWRVNSLTDMLERLDSEGIFEATEWRYQAEKGIFESEETGSKLSCTPETESSSSNLSKVATFKLPAGLSKTMTIRPLLLARDRKLLYPAWGLLALGFLVHFCSSRGAAFWVVFLIVPAVLLATWVGCKNSRISAVLTLIVCGSLARMSFVRSLTHQIGASEIVRATNAKQDSGSSPAITNPQPPSRGQATVERKRILQKESLAGGYSVRLDDSADSPTLWVVSNKGSESLLGEYSYPPGVNLSQDGEFIVVQVKLHNRGRDVIVYRRSEPDSFVFNKLSLGLEESSLADWLEKQVALPAGCHFEETYLDIGNWQGNTQLPVKVFARSQGSGNYAVSGFGMVWKLPNQQGYSKISVEPDMTSARHEVVRYSEHKDEPIKLDSLGRIDLFQNSSAQAMTTRTTTTTSPGLPEADEKALNTSIQTFLVSHHNASSAMNMTALRSNFAPVVKDNGTDKAIETLLQEEAKDFENYTENLEVVSKFGTVLNKGNNTYTTNYELAFNKIAKTGASNQIVFLMEMTLRRAGDAWLITERKATKTDRELPMHSITMTPEQRAILNPVNNKGPEMRPVTSQEFAVLQQLLSQQQQAEAQKPAEDIETLKIQIKDFLEAHHAKAASGDVASYCDDYAASINRYGKRSTRESIQKEEAEYFRQHQPLRQSFATPASISRKSASKVSVNYVMQFKSSNPSKEGSRKLKVELEFISGAWKIVSENPE
jgi:SUMO ligase MMS21 Smc5/6 complex component